MPVRQRRPTNVWQLVGLRCLTGMFGGFQAQSMALATKLAPPSRLAEAIGLIQVAHVLGAAIGPFFGGLVGDRYGFAGAVMTAAALNLVGGLAVTVLLREPRGQAEGARERRQPVRAIFALAGFVPMLAALALIRLAERTFDPLIPLLVVKLEPNVGSAGVLAGLIISLGTLATAASAIVAGRVGSASRRGKLLQAALLGSGVICLPLMLVSSIGQVLGLRLALGLAAGGAMTLGMALAAENVPAERRGAAFGVLGSATLYGSGAGMVVAGGLASLSFGLPFLAAGLMYVAAASATGIAMRQRRGASEAGRPDARADQLT